MKDLSIPAWSDFNRRGFTALSPFRDICVALFKYICLESEVKASIYKYSRRSHKPPMDFKRFHSPFSRNGVLNSHAEIIYVIFQTPKRSGVRVHFRQMDLLFGISPFTIRSISARMCSISRSSSSVSVPHALASLGNLSRLHLRNSLLFQIVKVIQCLIFMLSILSDFYIVNNISP